MRGNCSITLGWSPAFRRCSAENRLKAGLQPGPTQSDGAVRRAAGLGFPDVERTFLSVLAKDGQKCPSHGAKSSRRSPYHAGSAMKGSSRLLCPPLSIILKEAFPKEAAAWLRPAEPFRNTPGPPPLTPRACLAA